MYFAKSLTSGWIPPVAFLYFDKKGCIQDNKNVIMLVEEQIAQK